MTWSRFDDAAPKSPKACAAGNDAWSLWAAAVMYCNRHLTDGYVTLAALATDCLPEAISKPRAKKLADQLCAAVARPGGKGLFEEAGKDTWLVHDFLEWNPSKAEVESKRKKDRERKRGGEADSSRESERIPRGIPNGNPTGNPDGIPSGKRADSSAPRASARARPAQPSPAQPDEEAPPAADSALLAAINRDRFPMHNSWTLLEENIAAIEIAGVPRWAIAELVGRFRAHFVADQTDTSTQAEWVQRCTKWVLGDWRIPSKRPQKPDLSKAGDLGEYGDSKDWATS